MQASNSRSACPVMPTAVLGSALLCYFYLGKIYMVTQGAVPGPRDGPPCSGARAAAAVGVQAELGGGAVPRAAEGADGHAERLPAPLCQVRRLAIPPLANLMRIAAAASARHQRHISSAQSASVV